MHQHLQYFVYLPSGHQSSLSHRYNKPSPFPSSLPTFMEYSGILPSRSNLHQPNPDSVHNHGEVSIRIIGATEQDNHMEEEGNPLVTNDGSAASAGMTASPSHDDVEGVLWSGSGNFDVEADGGGKGVGSNGRDYSYQRYDIQHAVRWIEQVLPFSLLLLVVFIRQHLQVAGFFVTIWITAVLFMSNDILRKQTTVKGETKMPVLIGIFVAFALHVVGVYWWYQNYDLMYPLVMLPPKGIPPFWHAIFIIMVNGAIFLYCSEGIVTWLLVFNSQLLFTTIIMQWPQYTDLAVNGLPVRTTNRPGSQLFEANGRDDGPIITAHTKDGINKISLTILNLIPKESDGEHFEDALARVCRCVGGGNAADNADSDSDLEVVSDTFGINLRCPMSGSRMKIAGRFKPCIHMGCFDLEVFVEMNQRSRKWQCPICLKKYALENIVIDPYFNRITSLENEEDREDDDVDQ